jgi:hypothetical protein
VGPLQLLAKLFPDIKTDMQNILFLHRNGIHALKEHASHGIVTTFSEVQERFNAV